MTESSRQRRIRVDYDPPPIPDRRFDYIAVLENDDFEGTLVGYGSTEEAARRDLRMRLEDRGIE